jgi:hypothetical protein
MPMYRKKPVVIEARRVAGMPINVYAVADWCGGKVDTETAADRRSIVPFILIDTLEGTMKANEGDWIIKGVNGEFYPCKPDVFSKTYEPVEGGD